MDAKKWSKDWLVLLAAGALSVAPLLTPMSAQAAPVQIPANGQRLTLTGVVVRDLAGNEFTLRADDGRSFHVVTRSTEPQWVSAGDRVEIRGWREGDLFVAESIRSLSSQGGGRANGRDLITLQGVVTKDRAGNEFAFRSDDGRTFRVVIRNGEPRWVSKGDRVEVRGWRDGDLFVAENLTPINNRTDRGDYMTFSGRVTANLPGNHFRVDAENGGVFLVVMKGNEPRGLSIGDRVRVSGERAGNDLNSVVADEVTILSQGSGSSVGGIGGLEFSGAVTRLYSRSRLDVRADSGRTFSVTARSSFSDRINVGDRVRVAGRATDNDSVVADSVTLVTDRTGNLTLLGTVTRDLAGNDFTLRADDGRTYRVQANGTEPAWVSNGDRVEVRGWTEGNLFHATQIIPIRQSGTGDQRVDFSGSVTRFYTRTRIDVRADNGRDYAVTARTLFVNNIGVGDRVRIVGRLTDADSVIADTVTLLSDRAGNGAQQADFYGKVTRLYSRTRIDVRADDGRDYSVTARSEFSVRVGAGDRVRVVGRFTDNNSVLADTVNLLDDNNTGGGAAQSVNFAGRIEFVQQNGLQRIYHVRADNGQIYVVHYRNLTLLRVGDRVRVVGTFAKDIVTASSVTRL